MNSKEERIIAIVLVITIAASLAYCFVMRRDKAHSGNIDSSSLEESLNTPANND